MDTVQSLFTFKLDNVSGKNHARGRARPHNGKRIIMNDKLLCIRSIARPGFTGAFTTLEPLTITWNECSFKGINGEIFTFMRRGELVRCREFEFFLDDIA
jgi:hypothetical protein